MFHNSFYLFKNVKVFFLTLKYTGRVNKCFKITFDCGAADGFWGARPMSVLCRHKKPVRHRWSKIVYVCNMKFIFTIVVQTIVETSSIMATQSNHSKILSVSTIEGRYPLHNGSCCFTCYFYISGNGWCSCIYTRNQ